MKRLAGTGLLVVLLAGGAAGQAVNPSSGSAGATADEFQRVRIEARVELVQALEAHVEWCTGKSMFLAREQALLQLVELEPDHVEARRLLGFTRERDGSWKPPAKPRPPKDFDKKLVDEASTRLAATHGPYVERLVALLEQGTLDAAARAAAAAEVLRLEPDEARVRALLGEVRDGERWVLPETLASRTRREELRALVKQAFAEGVAAEEVPLNERERAFGPKWRAVAAGRVRVVGSAPLEELGLCATAMQALERFAQGVFGSRYALPEGLTAFLFDDPQQKTLFIERHPAIAPEARAFYQALEGCGVQGSADFAFWTGDAQRRIDGIVRLLLGYWLSGAFELRAEHGWLYEGFGLFLTRSLVRSRLTWLAQASTTLPSAEDMALRQKLLEPDSNWLDEARKVLQAGRALPLAELSRKGASELTTEDVLFSYALTSYLLEARPELVAPLCTRVGRGVAPTQALAEALALEPAAVPARLLRWLEERQ